MAHEYLPDAQRSALAFKIVELLNGVAVSEALDIVERDVPRYIRDGLTVDISHPRYQGLKAGVERGVLQ